MTNLQIAIEKARAKYEGRRPLLTYISMAHKITIRDFAAIFGISKSHAAKIMAHKKMPDLELGIRIARYWGVTVEELFGWRVDDGGELRPLIVIDPYTGQYAKLVGEHKIGAIELALIMKERDERISQD